MYQINRCGSFSWYKHLVHFFFLQEAFLVGPELDYWKFFFEIGFSAQYLIITLALFPSSEHQQFW